MKLHASLLVAAFGLFLLPGCGEQDGETGGAAASAKSKVDYQAIFNSIGVLKITHKDNNGQLIVEEAVEAKTPGTKWGKAYDSPPDPVGIEFYIAIDGERVQKGTKFLTKTKGMTLSAKRP